MNNGLYYIFVNGFTQNETPNCYHHRNYNDGSCFLPYISFTPFNFFAIIISITKQVIVIARGKIRTARISTIIIIAIATGKISTARISTIIIIIKNIPRHPTIARVCKSISIMIISHKHIVIQTKGDVK